ncbi:MAG: cytochrome b/b6 domain-containing protein, partial [Calditrichaeota bacterium]|nr:cytochrome b/b6 domain-containing protein [Calditrichota bacterium]
AKCSDCHGAHRILGVNNPNSMVGARNIVATCQKCHEDANARFTGYLTHATHHDRDKFPILYYTYWFMTTLLISVFGFFGVHTLLWLPRSIQGIRERKQREAKAHASGMSKYYIQRFTASQRLTHIFVIISFLALALTGMLLKFSGLSWARFIVDLMGGVSGAGLIHRFAAIITFGYFAFHLFSLIKKKRDRRMSIKDMLSGPNSLMFNLQDLKDFGATLKWFFGLG